MRRRSIKPKGGRPASGRDAPGCCGGVPAGDRRGRRFSPTIDRVADDLNIRRIALSTAASTLSIGNRAELARWRGEVRKLFAELDA